MKKKILSIILITISVYCYSQNINIPDANFKTKLLALGVDTNNDNEISNLEAQAITNLDISYCSAVSLTGIEAFLNLTDLNCYYASIETLDLSNNVLLKRLNCGNNYNYPADGIKSINISKNINLEYLDITHNKISVLDVSKNLKLKTLICSSNNNLTTIDLTKNSLLETFVGSESKISSIEFASNSKLNDFQCQFCNFTTLDFSNNLMLTNLKLGSNPLTDLNISKNVNLTHIDFGKVYTSLKVCVWELPFPPIGIIVDNFSTSVVYTTDCIIATGLTTKTSLNFNVFPTPSSRTLIIQTNNIDTYQLTLSNLEGKNLIIENVHIENNYDLDLSNIENGIYILTLQNKNEQIQKKIIVSK